MTTHRIASVHFLPRTSTGPLSCTCGASFDFHPGDGSHGSDSWSIHRKAAGVRIAHINQAVATEGGPVFVKRRPETCLRGHTDQWRYHDNGKRRSCRACQRIAEAERRQVERERMAGVGV